MWRKGCNQCESRASAPTEAEQNYADWCSTDCIDAPRKYIVLDIPGLSGRPYTGSSFGARGPMKRRDFVFTTATFALLTGCRLLPNLGKPKSPGAVHVGILALNANNTVN